MELFPQIKKHLALRIADILIVQRSPSTSRKGTCSFNNSSFSLNLPTFGAAPSSFWGLSGGRAEQCPDMEIISSFCRARLWSQELHSPVERSEEKQKSSERKFPNRWIQRLFVSFIIIIEGRWGHATGWTEAIVELKYRLKDFGWGWSFFPDRSLPSTKPGCLRWRRGQVSRQSWSFCTWGRTSKGS